MSNEQPEQTQEGKTNVPRFEVDANDISYQKRAEHVTVVVTGSTRVVARVPHGTWLALEERIAADVMERIGVELGKDLVPQFKEAIRMAVEDIDHASKKMLDELRKGYSIKVPRAPTRKTEKGDGVSQAGEAESGEATVAQGAIAHQN